MLTNVRARRRGLVEGPAHGQLTAVLVWTWEASTLQLQLTVCVFFILCKMVHCIPWLPDV